ncbi:hypothetical protein L596_003254 [Steinernema carpocapsae]|uniref:SAP domain-containing protein n=1 Tax=Steinernema carpocapsae TaxID=34508 RepID=A0A4U8UVZ0_STECR|nr:hypothetical protein L596_003254 [Steinernema carpocapsae]
MSLLFEGPRSESKHMETVTTGSSTSFPHSVLLRAYALRTFVPDSKAKIRKHTFDLTPYARPCQQTAVCLELEESDNIDSECKSNPSQEFEDLTNFALPTTTEQHSACHIEAPPTTLGRTSLESIVATPTCMFDNVGSKQELLHVPVDRESKLSQFTSAEPQHQKRLPYDHFVAECSQKPNGSPMGCDSSPTSTTVEVEKQKKLVDYKVQDLKIECKKRQLPVSGAKPQLLERLRPYEESILLSACGPSQVKSANMKIPKASITDSSCNYETLSPSRDVANEYPKQNTSTHVTSQATITTGNILQFNPSQQLVQLVDSTGLIVGVATVQTPSACCCSASAQPTEPDRTVPSVTVRSSTVPFPISLQSNSPQPTFSFAQHGSGGQFTLAPQESTQSMDCQESHQIDPRQTHHSNVNNTGVVERRASTCCQISTKTVCSSLKAHLRPRCFTSPAQPLQPLQKHRPTQQQSTSTVNTIATIPGTQTSPVAGDQPGPSPNLPSHTDSVSSQTPLYRTTCDVEDSSPSVLLSAQTFSVHEDMLRTQQKKIEKLQAELTKSQMQLRQQQQAILNAKKAQVKMESGVVDPAQAAYLNKLDIKNLNKYHIQLFLQHKLQLQKLQVQVQDFKSLQTAESKLQEELHIEQAVHDIVRLIKQDSRTALLIVQLLRRYQIERNNSMQAESPSTPSTSVVIERGEVSPSEPQMRPVSENLPRPTLRPETVVNEPVVQTCNQNCECVKSSHQAIEQSASENVHAERRPTESSSSSEASNTKKSSRSATKKRNGIKSIWSRMNSLKSGNPKDAQNNGEDENRSSTGDSSQGCSAVDMEEIFRTVLEDASRALNESEGSYCYQQTASNTNQEPICHEQPMQTRPYEEKNDPPVDDGSMIENGSGEKIAMQKRPDKQQQFIVFNPTMQTYVTDEPFSFQNQDLMEEFKKPCGYEEQNVVYMGHNQVPDNGTSLETPPLPVIQNANPPSIYDQKEFDDIMDALQRTEDGSIIYCPTRMDDLNGCTYSGASQEQWMEADSQHYGKNGCEDGPMQPDCSYINVYCGMNGTPDILSQQMQWSGEIDSSGQSGVVLNTDHGMFGVVTSDIYMQQGVASMGNEFST